jgi:uncharacterized membrane protein YjjB (DUF3815 family)
MITKDTIGRILTPGTGFERRVCKSNRFPAHLAATTAAAVVGCLSAVLSLERLSRKIMFVLSV